MAKKDTNLAKFDPVIAGMNALKKKFKKLTTLTPAALDGKVALVDGLAEVKDAKKELTTVRTSIAAAHKVAKAPLLELTRALDGKKKELENEIKSLEEPLDAALKRLKNSEAKAAADAQTKRIAELEAKVAVQEAALEANDIKDAAFTEKQVDITITSKVQLNALEKIIGKDAVKDLKHDEDGNGYTLGVLVRRKEMMQ